MMTDPISKWQRVTGWVLSGILAFVFLPSAFFKVAQPAGFLDEWTRTYPASSALPIGVVEVTLFVLYLVPKTRYLGGLLMLAYLGGAVATHLHAGDGMFFVPVLVGVSVTVFLMVHLLPGDPATIMLAGSPASAEDIENLRHELGLDRPIYVQYATWMGHVLQGDLGKSIHTRRAVLKEITTVFPSTLRLALAAMAVALTLGISLGILAALRQNSWLDSGSMRIFGSPGPST